MPKKGVIPKNFKECQRKAIEKNKGRALSEEHRKKISIALRGKNTWAKGTKLSDEHKKKISNSMIGKNTWMKGIKLSKKHCKNISISLTGKKRSEESRKRIKGKNNHFYGKKHSNDTIRKIIEARKYQVVPVKDTKIEIKIQNFLKQLKIEFIPHKYIKIKHGYQCDIFIPSMNLVIECDGDFFHMNPNKYSPGDKIFKNGITAKEKWEIDSNRTKQLTKKGFSVVRLWEHEINNMRLFQFENLLKLKRNNGRFK